MENLTNTRLIVLSLLLIAGGACSSKSDPPPGPSLATADGGSTAATGSCPVSVLRVAFSPMHSAFDGVHTFQVPAIVDGIAPGALSWSASDPSMVDLQKDASTGGVLITVRKAGAVDIVAAAGNLCGSAKLFITAATPEEWEAGSKRYNEGTVLPPPGTPRPPPGVDAGALQEAACTNCHGPTAAGPFKTVAHTPQQTAGFSDEQLIDIITKAELPKGGYFDASIVPLEIWQRFHRWQMTPEAARGLVIYLRSLTPAAQNGSFNNPPPPDGGAGPPRVGPDGGTD